MSPRPPGWRRRRAAALAGTAAGLWLAAGATPAWAHAGHRVLAGGGPWTSVVGAPAARAAVVAGAVPLAGLLLAPLLAGPSGRPRRRVRLVQALAVVLGGADLAGALWSSSPGPAPAAVLLVVALTVALAGASRGADAALGVAVLTGAVIVEPPDGTELLVAVLHLVSAALWVGVAVQVAVLSAGDVHLLRRVARLHRPVTAVTAAVVVTGVWDAVLHLPGPGALLGSGYGRVLIAKAGLVAGAALIGWAAHRRRDGSARRLFRAEAAGLAGVVTAAAGLILVPLPGLAVAAAPALGTAVVAGGAVTVLEVPIPGTGAGGAGRDLLFVGADGSDGAPGPAGTPGASRAGVEVPDRSGVVPLRALGSGWYVTEVTGHPRDVTVGLPGRPAVGVRLAAAGAAAVPAGTPLPDRATADAVLGRLAALRVRAAIGPPSPVAAPGRLAAQGASVARWLQRRGARSVGLVMTDDPAGAAFVAGFRGAAASGGTRVVGVAPGHAGGARTDALLVASGEAAAVTALDSERGPGGARLGVVLAPWLLSPPVLQSAAEGGPAVSVASDLDPTSGVALAYLEAERAVAPGFPPSYDGLAAFTAALELPYSPTSAAQEGLRLYAVTAVQFLPTFLDDHNHGPGGWFSSEGQLVPVTGPLA